MVKGTSPLNCHNLELTAARSDVTDRLLTCVLWAHACGCCPHCVHSDLSARPAWPAACLAGITWGLCSKPNGQPRWRGAADWAVVQTLPSAEASRGTSRCARSAG